MSEATMGTPRVMPAQDISFRPSTRAFLLKSGVGWMLIAVTVLSMGFAAIATVPLVAILWLRNITTRFELEGDRLRMRRGIIMRDEDEVELYRVKDIKARFSIIQQFFDNGDLAILSSDATGNRAGRLNAINISNVEKAREIREELRSRVEASRRSVGVREYDLA